MAPQWFSQFPNPCAQGGVVEITIGANAPFPFYCTLSYSTPPGGGKSWIAHDATERSHFETIPEGVTGGTVTEASGKSLAMVVNVV